MTKTREEINGALERLNSSLEPSGYMVKVGHRNGYTALDKCKADGGMIDYLDVYPSDKKALEAIYLMCKTAEMVLNPRNTTR